MLPYFPPAYPDELLYSLLARVHCHIGESSPKRTLDALFGSRSVRAGVALQGHLQALSERLPPNREMTPDRLLMQFTLYPLLTAFQPEEVRLMVRDALVSGHSDWVTVRLGLGRRWPISRRCSLDAQQGMKNIFAGRPPSLLAGRIPLVQQEAPTLFLTRIQPSQ